MENKSSNPQTELPKAYSCVRCFKRKVKCEKHYPCAACLRAKVECVFRIPAPPRRRHLRSTDEAVLARLKHYEDLLRENGVEFISSPSTTTSKTDTSPPPLQDATNATSAIGNATDPNPASTHRMPLYPPLHRPSTDYSQGKLIIDHGRARFIENKLWTTVSEESRHNKDVIPDSDTEDEIDTPADDSTDFVLAMTSSPSQTYVLHPSHNHMLKLWQIFLTNVNPLMKIVHQPTLQHSIESITDIEHLPRGLEALMFAIYGAAVLSMRDGECQATFGETRTALLSRYRVGARRSLTRARFMGSSDIMVLQALVIYLVTMRKDLDSRTLWTLTGIAIRIAQGMGVHRDGTFLGLPPFETEMRRRLWWQINLLDFNAAELSGFGALGEVNWWNTKTPSNVNDGDIWPGMKETPIEKAGATEMIACLLRYEVCNFWRKKLEQMGNVEHDRSRAVRLWVDTATIPEKNAFIDEFESTLEEKYLQYCDPLEPLHMMASIMGRILVTCKSMQIKDPRRYAIERDIPDSERQFLWTKSMSLVEADNLVHSHRSLQKFNWHTDVNFQWHALIYVLGELIARPIGENKDNAWAQIETVFKNHPNFISDHKKPLHIAIASMCLKAWRSRHEAQIEDPQGSSWLDTPPFVLQIQEQREAEDTQSSAKRKEASQSTLTPQTEDIHLVAHPQPADAVIMPNINGQHQQPYSTLDSSILPECSMPVMDDMAINWQTWDLLLNDFDMESMPTSTTHLRF